MKTHIERPKSGNARRAWDALTARKGAIRYMFYSRDHADGPRWVAYHGEGSSGYTGDANSPVLGGGGIYSVITSEELELACSRPF